MPKLLELKLKRQARKKFGTSTSKRAKKFIFGTLAVIKKRRRKS